MNELPILRDNNADYQTVLQISVVVKNFEDRKVLVNYIKKRFLSGILFISTHDDSFPPELPAHQLSETTHWLLLPSLVKIPFKF